MVFFCFVVFCFVFVVVVVLLLFCLFFVFAPGEMVVHGLPRFVLK